MADGKRTHERILSAAQAILARRGYHDTSIDDVVERSGTSKGSFYFHFPSKETMVWELADKAAAKLVSRVERAMAERATPLGRIEAALEALLRSFGEQRQLARLLLIGLSGQRAAFDRRFLPVRDRFSRLIERELAAAAAQGAIAPLDTRLVSLLWLGGLQEVLLRWLAGELGVRRLEETFPALRTSLVRSLGGEEAGLVQEGAGRG